MFTVGLLATNPPWLLRSQVPEPSPTSTPDAGLPPLPQTLDPGLQALPQTPEAAPAPTAAVAPAGDTTPVPTPTKRNPSAEPGDPALNTSSSFWLDNYPLNDLYQYLARQADFQYFQNPFLDSIKVTGELFKGRNPLDNMRELALQYNLMLYQKGSTIYALTQDQITTLPQEEFRYE